MVDRGAINAHLAASAVRASAKARRRKAAPLGHENQSDRRFGADLEVDLLSETSAMAPVASAAGSQFLAMDEQCAVALDQLDGNVGDIARPCIGALPVTAVRGPHATIEEQHVRVGLAVRTHAGLDDAP